MAYSFNSPRILRFWVESSGQTLDIRTLPRKPVLPYLLNVVDFTIQSRRSDAKEKSKRITMAFHYSLSVLQNISVKVAYMRTAILYRPDKYPSGTSIAVMLR